MNVSNRGTTRESSSPSFHQYADRNQQVTCGTSTAYYLNFYFFESPLTTTFIIVSTDDMLHQLSSQWIICLPHGDEAFHFEHYVFVGLAIEIYKVRRISGRFFLNDLLLNTFDLCL